MILIALGANLPSPKHGAPEATLGAAIHALPGLGLKVLRQSRWYHTAPEPVSDQPWYVNGVVLVECEASPWQILQILRCMESDFGRIRDGIQNQARCIDLDLLACGDTVINQPPELILPHPRMHLRDFVMRPLCDVAPDWMHPTLLRTARQIFLEIQAFDHALAV